MNKKLFVPLMLASLLLCTGCSGNQLSSWKKDGKISEIKAYIDNVCDSNSKDYIPVEHRISTWDIDGTGIVERNLSNNDLLPLDQIFEYTYQHYRSSDQTIKTAHDDFIAARTEYWKNEEEVTTKIAFRLAQTNYYNALIGGLTPDEVTSYFDEAMKNGDYTTGRKLTNIAYKPMKELYSYLKQKDFQIYFVSGTFRYALYPLAAYNFGNIDFQHCIGTDYGTDYTTVEGKTKVTFTTTGDICLNDVKANKILTQIGRVPVLAFGNSTVDLEMLQQTITNCKYKSLGVCINHDDDIREYKYNVDKVHQMCTDIGALEVSMKSDFLTIF